jgi:iron complex outermembrane recepter protein
MRFSSRPAVFGRPNPTVLALSVAAALSALSGTNAFAQQAPAPAQTASEAEKAKKDEAVKQLDRIVVTSTGRAQSAATVPYNVTAQSEEALREANITDIKKLIADSPSINAPGNGARFADSVTVRGLNVSGVSANNIEQFVRSTLSYYLDDTPLPNIGFRIKDIARVETLLGPQGTLYGAGSLGGTVRYITNQPNFRNRSARVSTSIYQTKGGSIGSDTDGMLNVPISDALALRIAVAHLDDGGYTDRVSNPTWRTGALAWTPSPNPRQNLYKDDDWTRTTTGRFGLAWRATPNLKVTLTHTDQNQLAHGTSGTSLLPLGIANARNPADVLSYLRDPNFSPCTTNCRFTDDFETPEQGGKDTVVARYEEFAKRNIRLTSLAFDWDLPWATLRSSTSSFKDVRTGQADYASQGWAFYYDIPNSFGDPTAGEFDSDRSAYITFNNRYSGVNHETRLTSKGSGPLTWIAGLYATKTKRSLRFSEWLPGLDAAAGVPRARRGGLVDEGYRENLGSEYSEEALYGEVGYKITPDWQVNVGARVFSYEDRGIAQVRDFAYNLVDNNVDVTRGENGKSYYKLNTSYQFTPAVLGYFTASQGFRRGGTNGFRSIGTRTIDPNALQYQPDSTLNYELGMKGFFFDRQLYLQANVYQIDWKDVQTDRQQTVSDFPVNGTANAGNARSTGFEMSTRWNITPQLQARYATAYNEAEWITTKTHCLYANGTSCRTWSAGGKLGGSPKWKHNFGLRYNTEMFGGNAFASLSGRYREKVQILRSDSVAGNVGLRTYPAHTMFDLRGGVSWDRLDLSFFIENVANKRAEISNQEQGIMGRRIFFTTPRTLGVSLSYNFD